jgi:hypothetical protein
MNERMALIETVMNLSAEELEAVIENLKKEFPDWKQQAQRCAQTDREERSKEEKGRVSMTREEIMASEKECLVCSDISKIIGLNAHLIHGQAIERPELLGFPVIVSGRQVRIPRMAFAKFMGWC